jgi:hypothetical protein
MTGQEKPQKEVAGNTPSAHIGRSLPVLGGTVDEVSRRDFLKLAGFAISGAAFAGCQRAPVQYAVPFLAAPDELIAGKTYDCWSRTGMDGQSSSKETRLILFRAAVCVRWARRPCSVFTTNNDSSIPCTTVGRPNGQKWTQPFGHS